MPTMTDPAKPDLPSLLSIVQKSAEFLHEKGVESARLNAELLIGHALNLGRMQLYLQFERPMLETELEKIRPLIRRRARREPLQHILGSVEWAGLHLKTDSRALIPRPETEYLVAELIPARLAQAPGRILDLGTGTGAIALALAKQYPESLVTAVDASDDALSLARENVDAAGLGKRVSLIKSDWFQGLAGEKTFDLIVSNPPYLTEAETRESEPEVRSFEPQSALTALDEGMSDLKKIITQSPVFLASGGCLVMETGIAQHEVLMEFGRQCGWSHWESVADLSGRDRFLFARP